MCNLIPIITVLINNTNIDSYKIKIEQIFEEYYELMLYIATERLKDRSLAEDAVSESFIKIMKHIGKLHDISSHETKGYIVSIVKTTSLDIYRKSSGQATMDTSDNFWELIPDSSINILESAIVKDCLKSIKEAIKSLPDTLKCVAYLSLVHECSHEEIAQLLGITCSTSKKRLSRAKQTIRKKLVGENYAD